MKNKSQKGCRATRWLLLLLTMMIGQTTWAEQTVQAPEELAISVKGGVEVMQTGLLDDNSSSGDNHYQQLKGYGCKAIYRVSVDCMCTINNFYLTWGESGTGPYQAPILRMPAPQGFYDSGSETTLYDQNGNAVEYGKPGFPKGYGPNDDIVIYITSDVVIPDFEEHLSAWGVGCYIGFKDVEDTKETLYVYATNDRTVDFWLENSQMSNLGNYVTINLYGEIQADDNGNGNILSALYNYDEYAESNEHLWFTIECEPGFTVKRVENNNDVSIYITELSSNNGKTTYKVESDDYTSLCNSFTIYLDYTPPQAPEELAISVKGGVEVMQTGLLDDNSSSGDNHYQQLKGYGCKAIYRVSVDCMCTINNFYLTWGESGTGPYQAPILRMPAPQGFYDSGSETTLYDQNGNAVEYGKPGFPKGYGPNDDIVIYITSDVVIPDFEEHLSAWGVGCYIGFKDVEDTKETLYVYATNDRTVDFWLENSQMSNLGNYVTINLYGEIQADDNGNGNILSALYNYDEYAESNEHLWFTIECEPGFTVKRVENNNDVSIYITELSSNNGKTTYKVESDDYTSLCNSFTIYLEYTQPQEPDADFVDLGLPSGTKWAKFNIEASSPEKFGKYYAWGEKAAKSTYTWKNYKYCSGTATTCKNIGYDISKNPAYDIAYSLYQEAGAGIPTAQQWNELISKCTWKESTKNKVKGYTVTGPNGNTIFLPFSGCSYDGKDYGKGTYAYYWTANNVSTNASKAQAANIKTGVKASLINLNRRTGVAIRPVITTEPQESDVELVDLGLSVKWASQNLGAANESAYGDYYAWGETETKIAYTWKNYQHANGSAKTARNIGANISQTYYDAAFQSNEGLVMPTAAQWKELIEKCTWKEATVGGIKGYRVTGPSGKSIFLPLSGCSYDGKQVSAGTSAFYWTSDNYSSDVSKAQAAYLKSGAKTAVNVIQRRTGAAIRPVERKAEYVDLNLPSRNLWTTCNLGANSEEQAGNYYAWAEKTPKNDYTWKNYSISLTNLPMYIDAFYTCDMEGFMLEGIAEAPYDPSCKKMFIDNGAKTYMRTMPTKEDFQELIDYCTIEEKTVLGIKGLRFTGPNGNTIFMPYAGSCYDGKKPQDGTLSCYWISDRMNCLARKANALKVQGGQATFTQCQLRTGLPIRPLYALVSELIIEPANSGLVDGINDVQQTEKTDDTIYNLQGIKVQGELKPGIYIQNGKKFVVK